MTRYICTPPTTSQQDVLRDFVVAVGKPDDPVSALVYSPQWCGFVLVEANGQMTSPDPKCDVTRAYEIRAFNKTAELRWRSEPGVGVRCVVLSETSLALPWTKVKKEVITTLDQTYLLWGQGTTPKQPHTGWSCLAEARIGAFWVPVPNIGDQQRHYLHVKEYVAQHESGNAYIIDERLCGFTPQGA